MLVPSTLNFFWLCIRFLYVNQWEVPFRLSSTVSAVRLMRIELGGAFADLLNERGKGSVDNEMGYVERTLGFRTRELDDRDLRLVSSSPIMLLISLLPFLSCWV